MFITEEKHIPNTRGMGKKRCIHLPEVGNRVRQWPLRGDVSWLPGVMVKLE